MRILFYRYGSICEPDFIEGFLALGHAVDKITLEITEKDPPADLCIRLLQERLSRRTYDFIFSLNFYPLLSEICRIYNIPYLCQTVDSPILELLSHSVENECNRIFLFDEAQYREVYPRNPKCVFHLPLATNTARWDDVLSRATENTAAAYQSDISFVGSLYTEKCPYDAFSGTPDYLAGFLDSVMEAQRRVYGYYFLEDVLNDAAVRSFLAHTPGFYIPPERSVRNDRAVMAQHYLCAKISSIERIRTLTALGRRFSVDLYTGSDTTGLPVRNCGLAKTHSEMPFIFHYSKINLNVTAKAIREGLPLRVFDVLGCGGFLLTNYQAGLSSCFTPGIHLDCYGSEEELLEKTEFYLTHEKDRAEIANCGQKAIKEYHNYPKRLGEMLSMAFPSGQKGR